MHWKRVGSAENEKEWATTHFCVSIMTKIFGFMSRHGPLYRDMGLWPQGLLCRDRVFPWSRQSSAKQDGFCRDRGFDVATEQAKAR